MQQPLGRVDLVTISIARPSAACPHPREMNGSGGNLFQPARAERAVSVRENGGGEQGDEDLVVARYGVAAPVPAVGRRTTLASGR